MRSSLDAFLHVQGAKAAFLVSRDGLLIAGATKDGYDESIVAAMLSAIFGAIDRAMAGIGAGHADETTIQTPSDLLYLVALEDAIAAVIMERNKTSRATSDRLQQLFEALRVTWMARSASSGQKA